MKEAESRGAATVKELADANVGRSSLLKTIEDHKRIPFHTCRFSCKQEEARETILGDVNRRLEETEGRARQVAEERDGLATSNAQLVDDHDWMQEFGVANLCILSLIIPCNTREAGFKAGYNECLTYGNALSPKKFTDERCALRGVDTKAAYSAAAEAYNGLIVPALEQIEACLEAGDYVDRLRILFEPCKDGEGTSGAKLQTYDRLGLHALFTSFIRL
ncbi:hypothetical protein Hanom_Chr12g01156281 [Helianthus anomalus]